jgi:hypothetical protein
MPISISFGDATSHLAWPILIGPAFEFHVTPPLALTFDAKFGPNLDTISTGFGMKVLAGVAYRI